MRKSHRSLALVVLLTTALTAALVGQPASAETPPGAATELIFAKDPAYTTPVTSGVFSSQVFGVPLSGDYAPQANGCGAGQGVVFAFVPASADPSAAGSAERPQVAVGDTVEDLFRWPAPDSPGDAFAFSFDPRTTVGPASDLVRIDERWPADTEISMVAVCYRGSSLDPAEQVVVADTTGTAITSWLQFTTVASTTVPTKTSAGFLIGVRRDVPVVSLEGTYDGPKATLDVHLTDDAGTALPGATGRIDFFSGTGAARELVGTRPLVDAAATWQVDVPPAGTQVVYQADYIPDGPASGTYGTASSHRYAVVGPTSRLGSTTTIAAADTTFGKPASATVKVRRAGAAASGRVAVRLDGQQVASAMLQGGRLTVPLPAGLAAGQHDLVAAYAGDDDTDPSTASGRVSVAKVDSALTATSKKSKAKKGKKGKKPRKLKVEATVTAADDSAAVPTGTIEIRLGAKVLASVPLTAASHGVVTLTLPKVRSKKRKVTLQVTFVGGVNFNASQFELAVKLPREPRR